MKRSHFFLLFTIFPIFLFAQKTMRGMAMIYENGKAGGLPGATVYWLNTDIGTTTDEKGWFTIKYKQEYKKIVFSFVGYKTDTVEVSSNKELHHFLKRKGELDEVEITSKSNTTSISYNTAANIINVSSEELLKAACCNLSESFETNPSIDVNFSDAVTGRKQINMLGLKTPYILISQENIPAFRGSSQISGLTYTPGTWVESIQITKGAGSVVHGHESIAGQINTELIKPLSDDRLFINLYGASDGRLEFNTHYNQIVSDKWNTGLYVHGNSRVRKFDDNNDNFLDSHLGKQINLLNRWQYQNTEKGWISFINLRYLIDEKQIGELNFDPSKDKLTTNAWGGEINTNRFDSQLKIGYVFPATPYKSLGFQTSYSNHTQKSYYGLRIYNLDHQSLYSNLLFNSIIGDTRNKFKTGLSFTYDKVDEDILLNSYSRIENSVGGFFEYSFDNLSNFTLIAGIRLDNHNMMGFFITPRLHFRYDLPWEKAVFKGSFGRGKRNANIFVENQQLFASNRIINIAEDGGKFYGLNPEIAWNYGVSYIQGFNLFNKKGDVILDFYRTDFSNQVIVDWETPKEISFYDLNGKSFANSFQAELNYNLFYGVDLRLSYKYYDVKSNYNSGLIEKPLLPKHRFFVNIGWKTNDLDRNNSFWKFDATYNWLSSQRFPSTLASPVEFQKPEYTKQTNLLNLQITKVFSSTFEAYLGGENITNTTQKSPIVSADNPFGEYFDSTMIYRPIYGGTYYLGLRYKLKFEY